MEKWSLGCFKDLLAPHGVLVFNPLALPLYDHGFCTPGSYSFLLFRGGTGRFFSFRQSVAGLTPSISAIFLRFHPVASPTAHIVSRSFSFRALFSPPPPFPIYVIKWHAFYRTIRLLKRDISSFTLWDFFQQLFYDQAAFLN